MCVAKYFCKENQLFINESGFVNSSVRLYSFRERRDPTLNCIITRKIQTTEAKETRDTLLLASIKN